MSKIEIVSNNLESWCKTMRIAYVSNFDKMWLLTQAIYKRFWILVREKILATLKIAVYKFDLYFIRLLVVIWKMWGMYNRSGTVWFWFCLRTITLGVSHNNVYLWNGVLGITKLRSKRQPTVNIRQRRNHHFTPSALFACILPFPPPCHHSFWTFEFQFPINHPLHRQASNSYH